MPPFPRRSFGVPTLRVVECVVPSALISLKPESCNFHYGYIDFGPSLRPDLLAMQYLQELQNYVLKYFVVFPPILKHIIISVNF